MSGAFRAAEHVHKRHKPFAVSETNIAPIRSKQQRDTCLRQSEVRSSDGVARERDPVRDRGPAVTQAQQPRPPALQARQDGGLQLLVGGQDLLELGRLAPPEARAYAVRNGAAQELHLGGKVDADTVPHEGPALRARDAQPWVPVPPDDQLCDADLAPARAALRLRAQTEELLQGALQEAEGGTK